ncbi:MAG: SIS domain-containing protein [Candidatus Heimdallarchaeota archaeon]|nr:SIS domain-containing protein [Candidatus Heimdallarchaeota archaeon]MCK5049314.1 SIS domain-containing protein [Candidatus Heimdallarchaeota archaeon]
MNLDKSETFAEMNDSIQTLIRSGQSLREYMDYSAETLHEINEVIEEANEAGKTIHFTGMGRSILVGRAIAQLMLNQFSEENMSLSIIGRPYARPVLDGDVLIAISGSGRTRTTLANVRTASRRNIKIIGITSTPRSELERYSDIKLIFDWCQASSNDESTNYRVNQILGKRIPLTPLGTRFELTTLLFGIAWVNSRKSKTPLGSLLQITEQILNDVKGVWNSMLKSEKAINALSDFRDEIKEGVAQKKQFHTYGADGARYICEMIGLRMQHLGVKIIPLSSWRFRKEGDSVLIVAGDGEDIGTIGQTHEAIQSKMKTTLITHDPGSSLDKMAERSTILARKVEIEEGPIWEKKVKSPSFELVTAILVDSLIAQIAFDLGITESEMIERNKTIK